MSKNIIIFGGTGFIGKHLIKKLKKLKFNVSSVSRNKPTKKSTLKGVKYILCDISNYNQLKKIKYNYDYVINLSGNIDHKNKLQTNKIHYLGCKNLSNFFLKKKIKLFIQAGSSLEYGNLKSPHIETKKSKVQSFYASAKLKSTNYLFGLNETNKFPFIVLRLYQVYGPGQKSDRLIPYVINNALKNKNFDCTNGRQLRDFIYIDDLINLFIKILNKKNITHDIYNVGTGKPQRVRDLIKLIIRLIKKGAPNFGKVKMRKEEILNYYANISKIKKNN